jgi:regulator of nucleoside diphosphate kinase
MSRKFLPKITLSVSDRLRLEQLVSVVAAEDHPAVHFLLAEIRRAEIVPDDSDDLKSTVTKGSSIRYRLNCSSLTDARKLVYPEDYASDRSHVSVLSPLGAALIGLRAGSRMPTLARGGCMS